MPAFSCPKGHSSSESDFCSDCGARIQGQQSGGPSPLAAAPVGSLCPDCGAPRAATSSNFCEVCGYNFSTGQHGNVPEQPEPPAVEPAAPPPLPPQPVKKWTLTAVIDPALREPDSPEPPAGVPPLIVQLTKPVNLIGRKSEKRAIVPEIALDLDDAVSHRHALLTIGDDGSLTLRDIGSSNGTRLNAVDVKPLVDMALNDGDQITLGRWTRLTVNTV